MPDLCRENWGCESSRFQVADIFYSPIFFSLCAIGSTLGNAGIYYYFGILQNVISTKLKHCLEGLCYFWGISQRVANILYRSLPKYRSIRGGHLQIFSLFANS
jgi:hypothetical protein